MWDAELFSFTKQTSPPIDPTTLFCPLVFKLKTLSIFSAPIQGLFSSLSLVEHSDILQPTGYTLHAASSYVSVYLFAFLKFTSRLGPHRGLGLLSSNVFHPVQLDPSQCTQRSISGFPVLNPLSAKFCYPSSLFNTQTLSFLAGVVSVTVGDGC